MSTVMLSNLALITRRPVDTIRNMLNRDGTPWRDEELKGEGHRRYAGKHALSLILCEMLESQGFSVPNAAEIVREQSRVADLFLADLESEDEAQPRFVLALRMAVEDSLTGAYWQGASYVNRGTLEEVQASIASSLNSIGRVYTDEGGGTQRTIGGPHIAVAPVAEAYRLLQLRAKAAGFTVAGNQIVKYVA